MIEIASLLPYFIAAMKTEQASLAVNKGCFESEAQALDVIVQRIVSLIDPAQIWLFGSRARGDHKPDSDFDILVVAKNEDGDEAGNDFDRVYAPILGTGVGCDVIPCLLMDFERESKNPTGMLAEILREGVKLYGAH